VKRFRGPSTGSPEDAGREASALTVQSALGMRIPFITADIRTADLRQRDAARAWALEVVWVES